ncbi:hypothetical protein AB0K00_20685 [Dactylosporangium sp. NPDC049525]|uniref:hypothetical protein n=1 Tax=Dactylosporangium sp. NPDC049525 TaxID=3154730 RepID=UPI00343A471B
MSSTEQPAAAKEAAAWAVEADATYSDVVITIDPVGAAEATRMLRAVLDELPPQTPTDRATARRIEGAACALDAAGVAGHESMGS